MLLSKMFALNHFFFDSQSAISFKLLDFDLLIELTLIKSFFDKFLKTQFANLKLLSYNYVFGFLFDMIDYTKYLND